MVTVRNDDEFRNGAVVGITTYVVWGLLTAYWKLLHHFGVYELIAWRIACAAVVMTVVVSVTRRWPAQLAVLRDRQLLMRVGLASLVLTANWTSYVWTVVHGHVLETALGYFIAPLAQMAVGVLVLHERLRRAQWVALMLGAAAVVVLTVSFGSVPWMALIIAGTWTVYSYLKRQVPLSPVDSLAAETFLLAIPAAVVAVVLAGGSASIPHTASAGRFVLVLLTGVATAAPLVAFAYAARRLPLTVLGPLQYIVPTINFLLGWLAYGEQLSPVRVIGFALIWVGLLLVAVDATRRARDASTDLSTDASTDLSTPGTSAIATQA